MHYTATVVMHGWSTVWQVAANRDKTGTASALAEDGAQASIIPDKIDSGATFRRSYRGQTAPTRSEIEKKTRLPVRWSYFE